MRNKAKGQRFYRRPRTTQERRANSRYGENWGRSKRNARNLLNSWDDPCACVQETWKVKRRHQYRDKPRGEQHEVFLDGEVWRYKTWRVEEWFLNHDIPFRLEKIEQTEVRYETHWKKWACLRYEKRTVVRKRPRPRGMGAKKIKTQYTTVEEWRPVYGYITVPYDEPRKHTYRHTLGWRLVWWSDKDIGIDYILRSLSHGI